MRRRVLAAIGVPAYEVAWIGNDDAISSGAHPYVDTEIFGSDKVGVDFTFDYYPEPHDKTGNLFLGNRTGAYPNTRNQYNVNFGVSGSIAWGSNRADVVKSLTSQSIGNRVIVSPHSGRMTALGVSISRPSAFTTDLPLTLLGCDFSGYNEGAWRCMHVVGHVLFTDETDTKTAEFMPMVRGGVACYWETVGRRWYYPIGGKLTAGPRV